MSPARELLTAVVQRAARPYIAGPSLEDALRVARNFAAGGVRSAVCCWNAIEDAPDEIAARYLESVQPLAQSGLDCYLSLKPPALRYNLHLTRRVVENASANSIPVHCDSHGPETAPPTFELIEQLAPHVVGCTLPATWQRSTSDAEWALRRRLPVRIIKGQWPGTVDSARGFLNLAGVLAGGGVRVGVATHNASIAQRALSRLLQSGTACELELLYGLPVRACMEVARSLKVPVRVYVPYGKAWLPYAMRRGVRDPKIAWYLVRDALRRNN